MCQLTGADECAKNGAHAPLRSTVIAIVASIVASIASAIVNPLVGIVLTIVLTIASTVLQLRQLRQAHLRFVLVFILVADFLELSIDNIIVALGGGVSTAVAVGLRIVAFGIRLRIHLLGEFVADGG